MTHTPGPWIVQPSSNPKNGTAWRDIVSTGQEYSPSYVGEALERDAHLIASAPEMLKVLHSIISHNDALKSEYKLPSSLIDHVQRTIAKAEGKE